MKVTGMHPEAIDLDSCLMEYVKEMKRGLATSKSILAMLPMYVDFSLSSKPNRNVIAIDIGGTNLRIASIVWNENGTVTIDNLRKYSMPGVTEAISKDKFFEVLAKLIEPYLTSADSIGISFAHETRIRPNLDGEVVALAKEVRIKGIEGSLLGAGLKEALLRMGHHGIQVAVTNDPVAAAVSGILSPRSEHNVSRCIGLILGTGTNSCYCEKRANITKLDNEEENNTTQMFINVESGNYSLIPASEVDIVFAQQSNDKTVTLEKMIGGRYFGGLYYYALKFAVEKGLFSTLFKQYFYRQNEWSTAEVSHLARYGCQAAPVLQSDREIMIAIYSLLIQRAGKLVALQIAGAAVLDGGGRNSHSPLRVVVEGTTFYNLAGLKEYTLYLLSNWLQDRMGIYTELLNIDNAVLKGAGIIAFVQDK